MGQFPSIMKLEIIETMTTNPTVPIKKKEKSEKKSEKKSEEKSEEKPEETNDKDNTLLYV